uniref:LysM peptidoglycan-binding domain-containing protein n=1 Tax=Paenibacillus cremeus TaxID=2163881 RepID=UPI003703DDE2
MKIHVADTGETLAAIARKYNLPMQGLLSSNPHIAGADLLSEPSAPTHSTTLPSLKVKPSGRFVSCCRLLCRSLKNCQTPCDRPLPVAVQVTLVILPLTLLINSTFAAYISQ